MAYTTADLLSIIQKRAFIPEAQETLDTQDILDMATDEMHSIIVPEVLATNQEWYVTPFPTTITSSTTELDIHSRAIGGSLRDVTFITGGTEHSLARLDLEDKIYSTTTGPLSGFYIQGNSLKLMGAQDGEIVQYFHARPGRLIPITDATNIVSVDVANKLLTVTAVPSTWAVGDKIDVIKANPHFEYRSLSLTITNIAGAAITVAETPSSKIVTGDWVSLEDTSPVPQIPVEWYSYLAQAVATQIFNSQSDFDAGKVSYAKSEQLRKAAVSLMSPRISGELKKAVSPKNRGSLTGLFTRGW